MPGAKGSGRGGRGRAEIPVAPAGRHPQARGARTRGAHGCGRTRAAGPPSCRRRVPAREELREACRPRAPARCPAARPGAGTGQRPGAWRRSPRASLLPCPGLPPAPVRGARRLCPGMAGDAGGGGWGFLTGQSLARGEEEKAGNRWRAWGFQGTARPAERRRQAARPAGSTRVDPEMQAAVGSRVAVVCAPQSQHTNAMRAQKPAPTSPGGVGARGGGRAAGEGALQGFGPAAAAAQRGGARAARYPPSALRCLPA